jgi:hypothetical protein
VPLPPAPPQLPALPLLPLLQPSLLLTQLEGAPPWRSALLLLLASWSSQQVRRPPPGGRLRALGVRRPPAPDLWVRQLLLLARAVLLARAESLLELSPTSQQEKMKVLAGGRTPQLERRRQTCSMRPKKGACHITDMVKAPEDKWRNEKFQGDHLHEIVPLPTAPGDWRDLLSRRGPLGPLVEVPSRGRCWRQGRGLRPQLRRRWWCRWALRRRWRRRNLLL